MTRAGFSIPRMGYGMTIPFDGVPLAEHRQWLQELVDLGYTDAWTAEADGADGFTPLALAAAWAPELRLGTAIIPAFTRGPGLLAQSAAALAEAAPGRFALGVGTSSDVIVERWNGIPLRAAVQADEGRRPLPAAGVHRREGRRRIRHFQGQGFSTRPSAGGSPAYSHRRSASGDVAAGRTRGRRCHHQLARRR